LTIYTAIFSNYDDLKEPFVITPGWRYICFTDQDLKSDVWEIIKVPVMECGPVKTARYYKIMFHKHIEAEFSIWVDATFIINVDLNVWWRRFKPPFTTIKHPFSDCIYQEANACISHGKDSAKVHQQIDLYRKVGIPENSGLIASGILMRQRSVSTVIFCSMWWKQVELHSSRDQIAFGYANHRLFNYHHSIEWDYTKEEEFIHIPHLHKHWRTRRLNEIGKKYGKFQSVQE
jgi:hypothetical protein